MAEVSLGARLAGPLSPRAASDGRPRDLSAAVRRYSVVVQTLAAIVFSLLLTAGLMDYVLGTNMEATVAVARVWRVGVAISIVAPALIAPLLAYRTGRLLRQVQEARDLMEDVAKRDALTGLLNRRGFQATAAEFWRKGGDRNQAVGLLMCDIDKFKSINDAHGHDVGDLALIHIAKLLRDAPCVPGAVLGRHGGEEFAILLPGLGLEAVRAVAEALRSACESNPMILASERLPVTLSIGASAGAVSDAPLQALLTDADRGLYEAKLFGRNRVVAVGPSKRVESIQSLDPSSPSARAAA